MTTITKTVSLKVKIGLNKVRKHEGTKAQKHESMKAQRHKSTKARNTINRDFFALSRFRTFVLYIMLIFIAFPCILQAQETNDQNSIRVGFQADFMRPAYPAYLGGRQVHKHEGNVVYTHKVNGATITCDSAYHYYPSDTIEFFSNVVVRHESTVLFGEKIFYDGIFAKVRGKLVKMLDTERKATLKTQFVDYNIDKNIGTYTNGGTLARARDTIESINGIFDGNTGVFTFINSVAMKNDSITLVCDTMLYDTHNDITTFIGNTKVWNNNNFMMSDYGWHKPNENEISFSRKVYMLSAAQEAWADSVFFDNATKNSMLFRNIQMVDTTQNVLIFGDKANISNNYETVIITENPSALYYTIPKTPDQISDTTYLTADTISTLYEKMQIKIVCDTCKNTTTTIDTAVVDTMQQDTASHNITAQDTVLTNITIQDTVLKTNTPTQPDTKNTSSKKLPLQSLPQEQQLPTNKLVMQDTLQKSIILHDTAVRNMFAYHNVKIYKSDFQAMCDSLVYHSLDSVTYMFRSPVLWNENMQITSGPAIFYSKNQQMNYAEFSSPALIIMREDTAHFNQLKGKLIKAFFKDNQLNNIHVLGNAQSVYYFRETPEKPISAVEISECANMIIEMTLVDGQNKISRVSLLGKPSSPSHPINKVPEDSEKLKGFAWHDDIRPKSHNELFDRQIRQSQRAVSQTFSKPTFKITLRINQIKEK